MGRSCQSMDISFSPEIYQCCWHFGWEASAWEGGWGCWGSYQRHPYQQWHFQLSAFLWSLQGFKSEIVFQWVGVHHQNGVAENAIRTNSNMAHTNIIHTFFHWLEQSLINLWSSAMFYAIWVHNHLPPHGYSLSSIEVWSWTKAQTLSLPC